jgi:hypothetical protein
MSTPAGHPPMRPSNEATAQQLDVARSGGDAYGKALQAMADEDGAVTCRIGDYLGPWAAGRPVAGVSP